MNSVKLIFVVITCFTPILIRTELTEPSMRIRSFWLRLMTTGLSNSCLEDLTEIPDDDDRGKISPTSLRLLVYYDVQQLGIRNFRYKMPLAGWLEWHRDKVYEQMSELNDDIV